MYQPTYPDGGVDRSISIYRLVKGVDIIDAAPGGRKRYYSSVLFCDTAEGFWRTIYYFCGAVMVRNVVIFQQEENSNDVKKATKQRYQTAVGEIFCAETYYTDLGSLHHSQHIIRI